MADYGLYSALQNMYSGPTEASKQDAEFAKLQQIQTHFETDRKKKEEASIKMMAYDEQVEKFANTLLAPDRNKIFQKSRMMKSSVRELIKANGGDMGKFFENGGHEILSKYKSSVVQSEESSQYLENKQNMSMILKSMNEGKSHLISPKDKASFDAYFANKGGRVSYSGVMNDIKMPDANKYEYGQQIPVEDILNENRTAILANYALYYKDTKKDPAVTGILPNDQELLSFTAANYGTQTGSNYQKKISENAATINENQELRTQDMYPIDKEKAVIANKQAEANLTSTELQNLETEQKLLNAQSGGGTGGQGGGATGGQNAQGGFTDALGLSQGETTEEYSLFTDAGSAFNQYNTDPNILVGNAFGAMNNLVKGNTFFDAITDGVWKDKGAKGYGYGLLRSGSALQNTYKPTAALNLFKNPVDSNIFKSYAAGLHGASYDVKSGTIKGFMLKKGMKGVYAADGSSLENGHNSGNIEAWHNETTGEYKVEGTIAAAVTQNGKNGKAIIMNENDKLSGDAYNKKDKAAMSFFTVMKNKNGQRIYVEVDPNDVRNIQNLQKPMEYTKARNQRNIKDIRANDVTAVSNMNKQNLQTDYNTLKNRAQFKADLVTLGNGGSYGDPMILYSFYATIKNESGGNANYANLADTQGKNLFNTMNRASPNLVAEYANGNVSTEVMFQKMLTSNNISQEEKALINKWKSNFVTLKHNFKIK